MTSSATLRDMIKQAIDLLPEDSLLTVQDFVMFQKYKNLLLLSDAEYLASIPGMTNSIKEGIETPVSDCVRSQEVWPDV